MASLITSEFEQYIAQQTVNGGTVIFDEFVFANIPNLTADNLADYLTVPNDAQIVHRQAVSQTGVIHENAVVYSVTMGTEIGDFDFNFIGLLNKSKNLLAAAVQTDSLKKLRNKNGVQGNSITRNILLEFTGAKALTGISVSAETWQIDFTLRLHGLDEKIRLTNRDLYGRAEFFDDGFLLKHKSGNQFSIQAGVGYVEGIRVNLDSEQEITVSKIPCSIYLDVSHHCTVTGAYKTDQAFLQKSKDDYQDSANHQHYVQILADIDSQGNITDRRLRRAKDCQSIAELRLLEPTRDSQLVNLIGYYKNTTQGGGVFIADFSDSTSADNGGTVIVTAMGKRWKRAAEFVTPYDFGARGDGITNDTPCFAEFMKFENGIVNGGTFLVDDSISFLYLTGRGKLIYGDGSYKHIGAYSRGTVLIDPIDTNEDGTPKVPADGLLNFCNGHLKFWADLDGDGDYDCDMYAQGNMYLSADNRFHFVRYVPAGDKETPAGRVTIRFDKGVNVIESAGNYSGTWHNHLAFAKYKQAPYWLTINKDTGYVCIGNNMQPIAPLHVLQSVATSAIFENTETAISRIGFKGSTTTKIPMIGASGDDLVIYGGGNPKWRFNPDGHIYPWVTKTQSLGAPSRLLAGIYIDTPSLNDNSHKAVNSEWVHSQYTFQKSENGWRKSIDGFIHQWGKINFTDGSNTIDVKFPISFNKALCVIPVDISSMGKQASFTVTAMDSAGFSLKADTNWAGGARYFAIGY